MGHDYGVPLRFLSVTPTRDNEAAPGNRLADKHSRPFHGKTLDEWLMIQLWSSKYCGKAVFVCETAAHAKKLDPLASKYNIELMVRPREMLHPINDSGALPVTWAVEQVFSTREWYSLVTTPFVVSPCRPPGFFDMMVGKYLACMANPDFTRKAPILMGGYGTDVSLWQIDEKKRGEQLGLAYLNRNPEIRGSITNHWIAASWWYRAKNHLDFSRHTIALEPVFFDMPEWQDIHIDTQDNWEWAEYWFGKKILSQGEDCYERYRESWQ